RLPEPRGGPGVRHRRAAHPPARLRARLRPRGGGRLAGGGDGRDPARDGPGLHLQVVPGDRPGRGRELPRRAAGRAPARPRRAALLALPHRPGQRGGGLRAAGAGAAGAPHRAAEGPGVKRWVPVALAVLAVGLALYPLQATGYGVRVMLQLFMWVALAQSWNLISGLTGYVSFGHVVFFGTGAYASSLLIVKLGWAWPLACLGGGVVAAGLAFLIGWPCLRLKGPYFAIATLGLNEVMRVVVSYYEGLTGGGNGLSLPTLDASVEIYYAMGLVAAAVTAVTYVIVTSRFGLRLMTIREDEVAAEAMGIDTLRYKLYALMLSAIGPGIVGGLSARDQGYIEPIS